MRRFKASEIGFRGVVLLAILATPLGCVAGTSTTNTRSPDGKYRAVLTSTDTGTHYRAEEIESGKAILTSAAQYSTPNTVKCCRFSDDSTMFAAGYHYGHAGNYTYVGVWSIPEGKFVRSVRLEGWETAIPDSVFEDK